MSGFSLVSIQRGSGSHLILGSSIPAAPLCLGSTAPRSCAARSGQHGHRPRPSRCRRWKSQSQGEWRRGCRLSRKSARLRAGWAEPLSGTVRFSAGRFCQRRGRAEPGAALQGGVRMQPMLVPGWTRRRGQATRQCCVRLAARRERARELRRPRRLTRQQLADRAGVSRKFVTEFEAAHDGPSGPGRAAHAFRRLRHLCPSGQLPAAASHRRVCGGNQRGAAQR